MASKKLSFLVKIKILLFLCFISINTFSQKLALSDADATTIVSFQATDAELDRNEGEIILRFNLFYYDSGNFFTGDGNHDFIKDLEIAYDLDDNSSTGLMYFRHHERYNTLSDNGYGSQNEESYFPVSSLSNERYYIYYKDKTHANQNFITVSGRQISRSGFFESYEVEIRIKVYDIDLFDNGKRLRFWANGRYEKGTKDPFYFGFHREINKRYTPWIDITKDIDPDKGNDELDVYYNDEDNDISENDGELEVQLNLEYIDNDENNNYDHLGKLDLDYSTDDGKTWKGFGFIRHKHLYTNENYWSNNRIEITDGVKDAYYLSFTEDKVDRSLITHEMKTVTNGLGIESNRLYINLPIKKIELFKDATNVKFRVSGRYYDIFKESGKPVDIDNLDSENYQLLEEDKSGQDEIGFTTSFNKTFASTAIVFRLTKEEEEKVYDHLACAHFGRIIRDESNKIIVDEIIGYVNHRAASLACNKPISPVKSEIFNDKYGDTYEYGFKYNSTMITPFSNKLYEEDGDNTNIVIRDFVDQQYYGMKVEYYVAGDYYARDFAGGTKVPFYWYKNRSPEYTISSEMQIPNVAVNTVAVSNISDCQIDITWSNINTTNLNGSPDNYYVIVLRDDEKIAQVYLNSGESSYSDTNIEAGKKYGYALRLAYNRKYDSNDFSDIFGQKSSSKSAKIDLLEAPSGLFTQQTGCDGDISVNWSYGASPDKFVIERKSINSEFSVISDNINGSLRTYIDTNINENEVYEYRIAAIAGTDKCNAIGDFSPVHTHSKDDTDFSGIFNNNQYGVEVSKGYYNNRVELEWVPNSDTEQYINQYKIYAREFGSTITPKLLTTVGINTKNYDHFESNAGIVYEYFIIGERVIEDPECGRQIIASFSIESLNGVLTPNTVPNGVAYDVGIRIPTGIVNGNITYTGGTAVPNVKVIAERQNSTVGKSLYFNGTDASASIPYSEKISPKDELTFSLWLKPEILKQYAIIAERQVSYGFQLSAEGEAVFYIKDQDSEYYGVKSPTGTITEGNWANVTGTFSNKTKDLILYVNGEKVTTTNLPNVTNIFDGHTNFPLTIGYQHNSQAYHFQGNIDDIRIYNKALSEDEVLRNYSKFIAADSENLQAYWKVFEGLGDNLYDLAHKGEDFHKNDGKLYNTLFKNDAPTATQLGNVGYTDDFGNYTIEAIEYKGTGENFNIIPTATLAGAVHEFDPPRKTIFIGEGSTVNNGTDFEDISSFGFSGFVRFNFEDTLGSGTKTSGSEGIKMYLNGITAITGDNNQVFETDENGFFDVQVPIGNHYIEFRKNGHTFANGRFPEQGTFDFQEDKSGLIIQDLTTHKFSGRVVGGIVEGNKPLSMSSNPSVNNIGQAKFTLTSQDGKIIREVTTDINTGEYTINLPPKKYTSSAVKWVNDNTNIIESGDIETLELNTILAYNGTYDTDSVYVDNKFNRIDSTFYNLRKDFIYRSLPELVITDTLNNPLADYGETHYISNQGAVKVAIDLSDLPFPTYVSNKDYYYKLKAIEKYTNKDSNTEFVSPISDGDVTLNNNIGSGFNLVEDRKVYLGSPEVISLDSNGESIYSFTANPPNINENRSVNKEHLSFTKQLTASLQVNGKTTAWLNPNDNTNSLKAYLIGGLPVGNNFVTKAPAIVDYVLRDPGGSNSYAFWEKGTTFTKTTEYYNGGFYDLSSNFGVGVGTNTLTGGGLAGVGEIAESHATLNVGINAYFEIGGGGEITSEETFSQRIETNANSDQVGRSDVFIAKSQNIQTGTGVYVRPVPVDLCGSNCYGDAMTGSDGKQYKMTRIVQTYTNPVGTPTMLIFSQNHIENVLIPDLIEIRNALFTKPASKYTSKLASDHPNFGTNNDNPLWDSSASTNTPFNTEDADFNGPSYTFLHDGNNTTNDSIRVMNQQIRLWKEALAKNEIDKWIAINYTKNTKENISISGGSSIEKSKTTTESNFSYTTFERSLSGSVGADIAFDGWGLAFTAEVTHEIGYKGSSTNGSGTENAITTGFVLYDENESDALSIDVYEGNIAGGSVFSTFGGQTMCPFEDKIVMEYATIDYVDRLIANQENDETSLNKSIQLLQNLLPGLDSYAKKEKEDEIARLEFERDQLESFTSRLQLLKTKMNSEIILSNATIQRDKPRLLINGAKTADAFNVPANESANFTLSLINESESNDAQFYAIEALDYTNPNGLELTIDGQSINTKREFFVQGEGGIQKTLKAKIGPNHYDYENVGVIIRSTCQFDPTNNDAVVTDTIYFNVKFLPVCTELKINSPSNNWTVNNSFNNKFPITIGDYDVNKVGFEEIKIQYKPTSSSDWTLLSTYYRNEDIRSANGGSPEDSILPTNGNSLTYEWDLGSLPDGNYDIRAVSKCALAENETEIYSGIIDRTNPVPFGLPQPSDGILSPGEQASVQFNETINENLLSPANFDIRGVLNGGEIRHTESVAFNGSANSYVEVEQINFANQPFTIDFYAKRDVNNANQVLVSQGNVENDELEIGFNTANQIYFKLGGRTVTGTTVINNNWHHYAFTYDPSNTDLSIYYDAGLEAIDNSFEVDTELKESLFIGKSARISSNYFTGKVHELRIWSTPLSVGDINIYAVKRLVGNEAGLLHNWQMEEANGTLALDKARAKHAKMNATWSVSPIGYALELFGTQDQANTTPVTFNNESDFTIEFWFKTNGTDQVLLSNGKGDGIDANTSGWSVGIDTDGKPYAQSNGEIMTGENVVNDGKWTHLAISHNARGNSVLYINAEEQGKMDAALLEGFGGSELSFGQQTSYTGAVKNTAKYFTGNLDEIRIWNAAIKQEQISRDRFNKLSGDEIGLVRYYPFDNYTENSGLFSVSSTLNNKTETAIIGETITTSGAATLNQNTPTIKLPRPVESVNFSYVVNNDKIIITLNTEPAKIENVALDFTVKNVKDLNGNSIQSPIKWTAFVDRNQVIWQDNSFDLSVDYETELNFDTQVVNNSGESKIFEITNIPFWLTVSPSAGTIGPLTTTPIKFKVSEDVNVGEYNTDLLLTTSDFGFAEKLNINVNVKKALPEDWVINPTDFEFSMNVIGQVSIDNVISRDENNLLGVFVNNECRGIAKLTYVPSYDNYQAFLAIYSDVSFGEELEFRVWEHQKGIVHTSLNHNLTDDKFTADTYQGTAANPKLFSTSNIIAGSIDVVEGWKWISFNLNGGDLSSTNNALSTLNPTNGDVIKTRINVADGSGGFTQQSLFDTYSSGASIWYGSLSNNGGLSSGLLYKVKLSEANKIKYEGSISDPLNTPLNMVAGWNFVGYVGLANIPINEALANFNAQAGDLIKSQYFSAIYDPSFGWLGTLKVLSPNEGYMIRAANQQTFKFPSYNSTAKRATKNGAKTVNKAANSPWEISAQDYENNMTIIGLLDNDELNGNEGVLGAFVNGVCKGYAAPIYNKNLGKNIFFLNVGDKENRADITFKYLDFTTNIIYNVNENSIYNIDAQEGKLNDPKILTLDKGELLGDLSINIYPNPVKDNLFVNIPLQQQSNISLQLFDTNGKKVYATLSENFKRGRHDFTIKTEKLSAGVYNFVIISDNEISNRKIIISE